MWLVLVIAPSLGGRPLPAGWTTFSNKSEVTERSRGTMVTAYFQLGNSSKHKSKDYEHWMANMLLKKDAMVVFTSPELVPWFESIIVRGKKSLDRMVVVPMNIDELEVARNYSTDVWEEQHAKDKERLSHHKTYLLYWIWLEKPSFVKQAAVVNPFASTHFMWSDVGAYRHGSCLEHPDMRTCHETQMNDLKILDGHDDQVMVLGLRNFQSVKEMPKMSLSIAGAQFVGAREGIIRYYNAFYATMRAMILDGQFVGEDQITMTRTCRDNADLCLVVKARNKGTIPTWFGLSFILKDNKYASHLVPECGYVPNKPDEPCLDSDNFSKSVFTLTNRRRP